MSDEQLIELYKQIAAHTLPECANTCRVPYSCCSPEYCHMAIEHAKNRWGVELPIVGDKLPLMGSDGCTAAPHLRPLCTLHTCQVNSMGCKLGDMAWTERYFELRDEIEELEYASNNT